MSQVKDTSNTNEEQALEHQGTYDIDTESRSKISPDVIGIDPNTEIGQTRSVYDYTGVSGIESILEAYDSDSENNISLGNITKKAEYVFQVLKDTRCVLIEIEPWFVSSNMGSDEFDRWEPFCIGFPETSMGGRQVKLTNLAPLSEITYQLDQNSTETPSISQNWGPDLKGTTRYTLDSCFNEETPNDPDQCGTRIDMNPIRGFHVVTRMSDSHLIIGSNDEELYCGRGPLDDKHVDVQIQLPWREGEYGEQKVTVFNDKSTGAAMSELEFRETHARYLGEKERWEVDFNVIEKVIKDLLSNESVSFVSLHQLTETAYIEEFESAFEDIDGYSEPP